MPLSGLVGGEAQDTLLQLLAQRRLGEQMQQQAKAQAIQQALQQAQLQRQIEADKADREFRAGQVAREDASTLAESLLPGEITPEQAAVLSRAPSIAPRVTSRKVLQGVRPVGGAPALDASGPQNVNVLEPTPKQAKEAGQRSTLKQIGDLMARGTSEAERRRVAAQAMGEGINVPNALLEPTTEEQIRLKEQERLRDRGEWKFRTDYQESQMRSRPPSSPPVMLIQTSEGPQLLDKRTGTTREITNAAGTTVAPAPTADMRNKVAARQLVKQSIDSIQTLGDTIITKIGPAQRATAAIRGAEAVFGSDPSFRAYQDARTALAGNLAVAQQGSRPSDADIKAIWLPLVPDPFRDTSESAALKWKLIREMSNVGAAGNEETETPYQQYLRRQKGGG